VIVRLPASDFIPKKTPNFHDGYALHPLYKSCSERVVNLLLIGPKGIGKSLSIASWAAKQGIPLVSYDCSEDARRSNLIGGFVIRGSDTPFVCGPVTTAIEVANEHGSCILNMEELNALTPATQKLLNGLCDWRRAIYVPEAERVFRLKDEAKLWVVASANETVYGGTYSMNEDLKSRFRCVSLKYMHSDDERALVKVALSESGIPLKEKLLSKVQQLAKETRVGSGVEYALSPRDIVAFMEDEHHIGIEAALRMLIGKWEGDDQSTIRKRIEAILDIAC